MAGLKGERGSKADCDDWSIETKTGKKKWEAFSHTKSYYVGVKWIGGPSG